ncbi:MAG: Na(+)-translocating NADH-quinone reductase subunit A [Bacteroidales bacterium]|nr:Na(+)-translocating NADH-quinone reductase subunit A [Bacteroidales bacterium]
MINDTSKKRQVFTIRKGLDLALKGVAVEKTQRLECSTVALSPDDFRWITPKLVVQEGDCVKVGTPLFVSKTDERLRFVSPVSGTVQKIVRGEKRKIERIVVNNDQQYLSEHIENEIDATPSTIKTQLLKYGLWAFVRQRPFAIIAQPDETPKSIFVSGFDSAPLAPNYAYIIKNQLSELQEGLRILSLLTPGKTFFCLPDDCELDLSSLPKNVESRYFSGPHPSGNVGTQIHYIDPINKGEKVWYVELQNVVTIGKLFLHKKLDFSKTIALCGEGALQPMYYTIVNGGNIASIAQNSLKRPIRIISGNVLTGKVIDTDGFIGFYDQQLTLIPEGGERELIGWLLPNFKKWSLSHTFLSFLTPHKKYSFNAQLHGGKRAFMLTDVYEKVFPFDILPLQLMKACIIQDIDLMEQLGIYEVTDEDFALCDVVCPSKTECQSIIYEGLRFLYNN